VRDGSYQNRINYQAIIQGANDFIFDEQTIKAVNELIVPTRLIIVDRGAADEPGGFISDAAAAETTSRNPNVTVERLRGMNHYTVLLGTGASHVASAVVRLL
jgi:hypothetical protein